VGVRQNDCPLVAGGQLRGGELVEVVDRAHTPAGRVGADAVLGVHHVVPGGVERLPQQRDRAQDPLPHALAGPVRERHDPQQDRRVDRPEEAAAAAQRPHRHVVAEGGQGFGQREGVHHPAAGPGRVAEQRDPHDGPVR
jgi:hypothetical protein